MQLKLAAVEFSIAQCFIQPPLTAFTHHARRRPKLSRRIGFKSSASALGIQAFCCSWKFITSEKSVLRKWGDPFLLLRFLITECFEFLSVRNWPLMIEMRMVMNVVQLYCSTKCLLKFYLFLFSDNEIDFRPSVLFLSYLEKLGEIWGMPFVILSLMISDSQQTQFSATKIKNKTKRKKYKKSGNKLDFSIFTNKKSGPNIWYQKIKRIEFPEFSLCMNLNNVASKWKGEYDGTKRGPQWACGCSHRQG